MDKARYRELYMELKDIKSDLKDVISYNSYVGDLIDKSFKIDNFFVERQRFVKYSNKIIDVKEVISNELMTDIYS